jgi:hypothetical protein
VREFFRGWRRKAGLVTLMMALLLGVVWLRSSLITDRITIATAPQNAYSLVSDRGRFSWHGLAMTRRKDGSYHLAVPLGWESLYHSSDIDWIKDLEDSADEQFTWRRKFGGFIFGRTKGFFTDAYSFAVLPYWSLVLPLTLLSAWLLLIMPRPAKSAKESSHPFGRGRLLEP